MKLASSILILSIVALTLISVSGCDDDQAESPIIVFLNPEGPLLEANANDRLFVTVSASTNIGSTLTLGVQTLDDLYGIQTVFDSTFNSASINYLYEYIVPQYPDSTESLLIFNLTNDQNNRIQIAKRILINRGESFITETSGHVIHSALSDKPHAFSLTELSPGYLSDSGTFSVDIMDNVLDSASTDISRSWVSETGISFVEFNGFNYAGANSLTIKSAYETGVKLSKITGIQDSDIYLVGKGSTAIGAIQIVAVTDQSSVQDDKYTFSIKKID